MGVWRTMVAIFMKKAGVETSLMFCFGVWGLGFRVGVEGLIP